MRCFIGSCIARTCGSIAVRDVDVKPISDIDIIYADPSAFDLTKARLERTGYYYNGNKGVVGHDVFRRRSDVRHPILDRIKYHLYICQLDSPSLERPIVLRLFAETSLDEVCLSRNEVSIEYCD